MKRLVLCFILLKTSFGFAQKDTSLDVFGNVDRLDLKLTNLLNSKVSTLKVNSLKGKAVIFDFGSINCRGCLKYLPDLEALQERYPHQLQVIWITNDSKVQLEAFLDSNILGKAVNFPVMCQDTLFYGIFKPVAIPELYWIDTYGNIMAKTWPNLGSDTTMLKIVYSHFRNGS